MKNVEQMGNVAEFVENLERENSLNDWIMMGLRLSDGIDISSFSDIYNAELKSGKINYLFEEGLLKINDGKLKITKDGRIFSNLLIEKVTECVRLLN